MNLLSAATVSALCNLVIAQGTVYQSALLAFDMVSLLNSGRQLNACGLRLQYVDTRRGYALSSTNR